MLRNLTKLLPRISNKSSVRHYTPRRAVLYVPASDLPKVLKAFILDVDCVILDCEDGVALSKKAQARLNIRDLLDKGKPAKKRPYDFCVRVNGINSGLLKDDLAYVATGKNLPDTFCLPKVESPEDIKLFSDHLNEFVKTNAKLALIICIESANALINSIDICKLAKELSKNSKLRPAAILFGSDDFCASIGATRTEASTEIIYARQKIVTVAKAFDLQAIDMVYIKYKDLEGLKRQATEGAQWGFTGKQIIHPGQSAITQKAFFPSEEQIAWASGVMKAFNEHQKKGQGAFVYKGLMIDMPTMKQAENIMNLVNALMMTK